MTEQLIVAPDDTYVLDDVGDNRLTLTACHPKLSSKQRIVIHAVLVGSPVDRLAGQDDEAGVRARPIPSRAPRSTSSSPSRITRFPGAWWGARLRRGVGGRPPDGVDAAPEPAAGPGAALPRRHPDLPLPALPVLRVGQLRGRQPSPAPLISRPAVRAPFRRRPVPSAGGRRAGTRGPRTARRAW